MSAAPDWFAEKFRLAELTICRYDSWTWSLRPVQCTLGASVLSLNRPCEAWGEVTAAENAELASIVADMEARLRTLFAYEKINYLMLMMVDPHVHFHVVPRYSQPKSVYGIEWLDPGWPKPPELSSGPSDAAVLQRVCADVIQSR